MKFSPNNPLLNPELTRPNWKSSTPRDGQLLWLDKNENLDPELLQFTGAVLRSVDSLNVAVYPEFGDLYQKLAKWLNVSPDSLILTPGSDGAIRLAFEATVKEGAPVLHTSPTFAMYSVYCQMFGATEHLLKYEESATGPRLELEHILNSLKKVRPKLFCLPNPDSPTGTIIAPEFMRQIIELCQEIGTVILIDEAYHPFYTETCVPLVAKYSNLVIARTFAKAWGLAGLRIGYSVGHPETIGYLHKLRPMYEVSTIAASVVDKMLDHPDVMALSVRRLLEGKAFFLESMQKLGFNVLHGQGNFLHVNFGQSAHIIHARLKSHAIYRLNFSEPCLSGYSRFSATTVEQFAPLVERIASALK